MRRLALLAALLGAVAAAGGLAVGRGDLRERLLAFLSGDAAFRLPERIRVRHVAADLSAAFERGAARVAPAAAAVRVAEVRAGPGYVAGGGRRRALVAPPPTRLAFRVPVPAGARLDFGIGTAALGTAAVRFAVRVAGTDVFAEVRERSGWSDHEVDLAAHAGPDVEIDLVTEVAQGEPPAAALAAWSHVRLVRETEHARRGEDADHPNVLLLLVDTLRADVTGAYGARPSPTPNLDRLAAGGLVFDEAVAQASWTMPSVPSIFTGLHPRSHGLWGPGQRDPGGGQRDGTFLADSLRTLAGEAGRAGITTVAISTNPLVSRGTNVLGGFETVVEYAQERRFHPEEAGLAWARAADVHATFRRWLGRNHGRRFLAYLHYMEPHRPYTPPAALRPPVPPDVRPAVADGRIHEIALAILRGAPPLPAHEVRYLRRLYLAEVRAWDAALPELFAILDAWGLRESTLVVVTSDHGEEFQEHGRLKHGTQLYEETIRVPLVLAGPAIRPGRTSRLAQGIDLFPTLARVLGIEGTEDLPGRDLLAPGPSGPAFSEANNGTPGALVSVRTPRWKLLHAPAEDRWELYDLARDPGERDDLFGRVPAGARLATLLEAWRATTPPPPPPTGGDPALDAKLRALGYVE